MLKCIFFPKKNKENFVGEKKKRDFTTKSIMNIILENEIIY